MARGFGAVQRAILDALSDTRAGDPGVWAPWPPGAQDPVFQDSQGTRCNPGLVYRVSRLRLVVARQRGGVTVVLGQAHQTSIALTVLTAPLQVAFARALRGLMTRPALVPVPSWVPGEALPQ